MAEYFMEITYRRPSIVIVVANEGYKWSLKGMNTEI